MNKGVDLGFAENCEPWEIESRMFASKIGGKPAWLDLDSLPSPAELECKKCKEQLIFLCQVYSPYENDETNFHRTIFIFVCRNNKCYILNDNGNIKVFRSHLRRENKFYSYEPPDDDEPDTEFNLANYVTLCNVCGCLGEKRCGKCQKTVYCSREHQVMDWKENHKVNCGNANNSLSKILFKEYELVIDPEEVNKKTVDEDIEIKKFEELHLNGNTGTMVDVSDVDLEQHANINQDKTFNKFKKRIEWYPVQVIRYERDGEPLWIAESPKPVQIPNCEFCGGPRRFEFQIMPQMLTILSEHEIDWGILCIYTCKASCTIDNKYKLEYVFKQDCSNTQI